MKLINLCFFILLMSSTAFGQRFQPVIKPIGLTEKIIIRGYKGKLQVVPTDSDTVKVDAKASGKNSGWTFQVRQKQNMMEIVVVGPTGSMNWEEVRNRKGIPDIEMKVIAPHRPLEVFWDQGEFYAEKLKSNLNLQMTTGKARIADSEGRLLLQMIKGQVQVKGHQGNIDLQSFKGRTILEKTKGAITLNNHSAIYSISDHQGPIDMVNHSGRMVVKGVKGSTVAKNVSGVMSLSGLEGSLSGQFEKGALEARFKSLENVTINSDEAAITIDAPKESGARVDLRSEKGHMRAPIHIGKNRKGRWTHRKGRLKGKEQGNIKIISKYGNIVLK